MISRGGRRRRVVLDRRARTARRRGSWRSPAGRTAAGPARTSPGRGGPRRDSLLSGASGVRIALRTHSRSAVCAGTAVVLPGSVTVSCWRPAFAFAGIALMMQAARLMLPLSPISRPWFGSNVLVAGWPCAGSLHGCGAASGPGPETLRMLQLEVLDLVVDRRVVEDLLLVAVARVEARVERQRLARPRAERPDDAVGQAVEVAARAALPALAREPVVGRARWRPAAG